MIKHEHINTPALYGLRDYKQLAPLRREHRKTVEALANLEHEEEGEREALTRKIGSLGTLINPRYNPTKRKAVRKMRQNLSSL